MFFFYFSQNLFYWGAGLMASVIATTRTPYLHCHHHLLVKHEPSFWCEANCTGGGGVSALVLLSVKVMLQTGLFYNTELRPQTSYAVSVSSCLPCRRKQPDESQDCLLGKLLSYDPLAAMFPLYIQASPLKHSSISPSGECVCVCAPTPH